MINIIFFIKILHKVYFRKRDLEIKRGRSKLRRIKVDKIFKILQKNCDIKNIELTVIEKNWDSILVRLKREKKEIIFKYHNTDMVFKENYIEFLNNIKNYKINQGVYITTGVFEAGIHKKHNQNIYCRKIFLEDYKFFLMKQLRLRGTISKLFRDKKLNFYKYLPK